MDLAERRKYSTETRSNYACDAKLCCNSFLESSARVWNAKQAAVHSLRVAEQAADAILGVWNAKQAAVHSLRVAEQAADAILGVWNAKQAAVHSLRVAE